MTGKLSKKTLALWAKKSSNNSQLLWLPLITHLVDTEKVINWLYHHWLNDEQRRLLIATTDEAEIERVVKFLGFFHDLGKATPAFQTKQSYNHNAELDNELMERLLQTGFSKLADFHPSSRNKSPHALAGEAILEAAGLNDSIGAIIGGHHGQPASFPPTEQITEYTSNYFQSDQDFELQDNWKKVQAELINYGLALVGFSSLDKLPVISQPQAALLNGLLIMADWLSSSEYLNNDRTKPLFPLIGLELGYEDIDEEERFESAILTWDLSDHWQAKPITNINDQYEQRWHFSPRKVQQLMSETINKITDPGIILIEAPMGIGKTEIALTAVEQLSSITGATGLFMGLPTQATTNAMFTRIEKWLESISNEQQLKLPLKLMHGKAQFNEEFTNLPRAENITTQNAVVVNSWFSGKKSILTDFSIGTIDHLLLMGLKQKHLVLRHLGLSGKVVIIDEIHSYDAYMNSYLKRALEWLGAYHVPVIALSATLPQEKRTDLVKAYYRGKFSKKLTTNLAQIETSAAYPVLTYLDGKEVKQFSDFPKAPTQQVERIIRLTCDDKQLINKVVNSISEGGVAGVVVNTVKRAQSLAQLIPATIPKLVLHSAFLAPDRAKLEKQLQQSIGKGGQRPQKMVVIGTQVLEQSLDIDFDILFTDMAPIDLILQRMGRLHRHDIKRPKGLEQPIVYITGFNSYGDYGDANEAIYDKYWLMKTDHFLPAEITIPDDISKLVQMVYSSKTDSEVPAIELPRHQEEVDLKKEKQKARAFQIKMPRPTKTLHGWLDRGQEENINDATAEAAVRDIKETIEVVLVQHTSKGNYLVDGRNIIEVPTVEIAQQLIRLPNAVTPDIATAIKKLETLTMKYYPDWQEDPWLRGMLALPLDEKKQAHFNGWLISYSKQLGLIYEKEE